MALTLLCFSNAQSQIARTKTWVFGDGAGLKFTSTGYDTFSVPPKLNHYEGNGIWNDKNGDLMYYTDAHKLYNNKHELVNTDFSLKAGGSSCQAVILTSVNDTQLQVFGIRAEPMSIVGGYFQSTYNMIKDTWEQKAVRMEPIVSECQAHVNHQNGKWQWVVAHSLTGSTLYSYLIKEDGLEECPVVSYAGPSYGVTTGQGVLKFSPDGQYLFMAAYNLGLISVCKFNKQTGSINELFNLNVIARPYGLEILNNTLFVSLDDLQDRIISFSVKSMIKDSVILSKRIVYDTTSQKVIGQIQTSLDGRLYVSLYDSKRLGIIRNNNGASNFTHSPYIFDKKSCGDGFPNFNASFFHTPSINFTYKHTCHSYAYNMVATDTIGASSYAWQISKAGQQYMYQGKELAHTFKDTGIWQVRLLATNGLRTDSVTKNIEIFNIVPPGFLGPDVWHKAGEVGGTLFSPAAQHCVHWYSPDTLSAPNLSYTKPGTYVCKATNKHFCHRWDTIVINECDTSFAYITRKQDSLFTSQVYDSTLWLKNGQQIGEGPYLKLNSEGTYQVIQTNMYGCTDTAEYKVTFLYASTQTLTPKGMQLYPNPNKGEFVIKGLPAQTSLQILDMLGRKVAFEREGQHIKLTGHINPATYMVQVNQELLPVMVW